MEGLLVQVIQATEWDNYRKTGITYHSFLPGIIKGIPSDESKNATHCKVQILRYMRSNEYKAMHSIPDVPKDRIIPW